MQDSDEDWRIEAGCMDKVYLNSFCTIAATLATSPEKGLFWNRRADLANPFDISFTSSGGSTPFRVFQDLQYLILNHAPLYKRGWVFQESFLSPRTIHFSKFPSFECRETFACETYRTNEVELIGVGSDWLHRTGKTITRADSFTYDDWWNVVYEYSRCNLTKETDKLIALCGIVKALSSAIPGDYYAGIWAPWWLQGLLWTVDQWLSGNDMTPFRPLDMYRGMFIEPETKPALTLPCSVAPSWSWASVDAPIQPWAKSQNITQVLVELQSIHTVPANGDPFGQLSNGSITLRGKLFVVPQFRALAETDRSEFAAFAFSLDDLRDDHWDEETFFLPLVESPDFTTYHYLNICGLLLQLADDGEGPGRAYERIGFAVVEKSNGRIGLVNHRIDNWTPPPWSGNDTEEVVIL